MGYANPAASSQGRLHDRQRDPLAAVHDHRRPATRHPPPMAVLRIQPVHQLRVRLGVLSGDRRTAAPTPTSSGDRRLSRVRAAVQQTADVKVHHLNCGTLYPLGCGELVCHVLLVETGNGLVLIDTGFGPKDCGDPARRVGASRHLVRPVLNPAETAANQVEQLGFRRDDVRHIVITHFDNDHIGGIADFPGAQIHVTAREAFGARGPRRSARRSATALSCGRMGPRSSSTPRTVRSGGDSPRPRNSTRCRRASC